MSLRYVFGLLKVQDWLKGLEGFAKVVCEMTAPNDLIVLSPTGECHGIPWHAVPFDSEDTPLIRRNPMVHSWSVTFFRKQ